MHLDLGTTGPGPAAPPGGINPGINITIGDIGSKTPCEVDRTRAAAPHAASPPQLHADAADAQPDARAAQPVQPDVGHTRDTGRPKTRPTTASRPLTRAGRPLTRPTPEARQMLPPSSTWIGKGPGKRGKDHVARGPEGRNPGALRKLREWRQRQRLRTQRGRKHGMSQPRRRRRHRGDAVRRRPCRRSRRGGAGTQHRRHHGRGWRGWRSDPCEGRA